MTTPKRRYRAQRYTVTISWFPTRNGPTRRVVSLCDGHDRDWPERPGQAWRLLCEAQRGLEWALERYLEEGGFRWRKVRGETR